MSRRVTLLALYVVSSALTVAAQLRVFKTYNDYLGEKAFLVRDSVHMNGAYKKENSGVKFRDDAGGKAIDLDPKTYWGITYDSVLFRNVLDRGWWFAGVRELGPHLFLFYSGVHELRYMSGSPWYREMYQHWTGWEGLLETVVGFSTSLDGPVFPSNASKKEYVEHLGRYFKEDGIEEFSKAFFKSDSDKKRYDALMQLLKTAKE